jgi:hypothetical protein
MRPLPAPAPTRVAAQRPMIPTDCRLQGLGPLPSDGLWPGGTSTETTSHTGWFGYQRAGSCIRTPVRVQLRRRFGRGERGLPRSTRRSYAQLRITPIRLSPRLCGSELLHDPVTGSVRPPEWRVWYDGLVLDKGRPAERGPAAIILVHRPANMTRPDRVIPACAPRRRKWRSPTPRGRRAPRYHGIGSSRSVPASTAWRRRRLVSRTPVVAAGPTTRVGERRRGGATHEQCHSCHHRCNPALHDPHLQQQT